MCSVKVLRYPVIRIHLYQVVLNQIENLCADFKPLSVSYSLQFIWYFYLEGSFHRSVREQLRGLHALVTDRPFSLLLFLYGFTDYVVHVCGLSGKDTGFWKAGHNDCNWCCILLQLTYLDDKMFHGASSLSSHLHPLSCPGYPSWLKKNECLPWQRPTFLMLCLNILLII